MPDDGWERRNARGSQKGHPWIGATSGERPRKAHTGPEENQRGDSCLGYVSDVLGGPIEHGVDDKCLPNLSLFLGRYAGAAQVRNDREGQARQRWILGL